MLRLEDGMGPRVLAGLGVTFDAVRDEIERLVGHGRPELTDDDVAALRTLGIDVDEIRRHVEEAFGPGALDAPVPPARRRRWNRGRCTTAWMPGSLPFTPRAKGAIAEGLREAIQMGHHYLGTEHLLLALSGADALSARILEALGADRATVRA